MKEMKPVAAVVLLFCFAAAAEVCAAESAPAKGVGERHERTTERMYADQDADKSTLTIKLTSRMFNKLPHCCIQVSNLI